MNQTTPIKSFNSLNICLLNPNENKPDTPFSARNPISDRLYPGTKNLKTLLDEMDALGTEVEQKFKSQSNPPNRPKAPSDCPDYNQKVAELENQNLQILRIIRQEEESHYREKVKWHEQAKLLSQEIEDITAKENQPLKQSANKILCASNSLDQENLHLKSQLASLTKESQALNSNLSIQIRENQLLKSQNKVLEDDNKTLVKEYQTLKERFSRYQTDQDAVISTLESEINNLSTTISYLITQLSNN